MRESRLIGAVAVLGLLTGLAVSTMQQSQGETYCERLEADLQANQSIQGAVACYSPGSTLSNSSEDAVEENTELSCICRQQVNGSERTFTIRRSN